VVQAGGGAPLAFTSAGKGPAVLLLHGQAGGRQVWFRLQPLLLQSGFRVISVDRPGYERTGGGSAGFAENARRMFALLDHLGIDEVTVFAHSWSGGAAVAMALQQPRRVHGLVLQGSVGGAGSVTFGDRMLALPVVGAVAMAAGLRLAALGVARGRIRRRIAPELTGLTDKQVAAVASPWTRADTARVVAHEQRSLIHELPVIAAQLPYVRTPTVVLVGRDDVRVTPASQRDLAARLRHAELVEVDGGHLLAAEDPEAVVAAIRRVAKLRA
jgi:pimeloyl-ACP methyl ester carboxylesterase